MNMIERAREVVEIEMAGLQKVRDSIGPEFERAVRLMEERVRAGGKIVVTGLGKSFHISQKIAATLTSTGAPAVVLHPAEAMHGDLGLLQPRDVVLALSYSGESEELLGFLSIIKRSGVAIIALTGEVGSSLARYSDTILSAAVDREACPFNMAPTASTTAALALGDALAMVLLEARGFQKEDYAKLHPGGAIGRTLLLRVGDFMRTGERLAQVRESASVKDAVLAMTSARAGAVAVVDEEARVCGIFTDGDLRRHLPATPGLLDLPVARVMTPRPISLSRDHLAVDVLAVFEAHNIDDLVIVDDAGCLVGMVDLQDLPKMKIL